MAARTSAAATGVAAPRLGAMILVCLAAACGGGSMPSQPQPDFTLSVTPSETYAVVGNTTAPVGISVAPQNGFSGTVTITLQGLPPGTTHTPSALQHRTPGLAARPTMQPTIFCLRIT